MYTRYKYGRNADVVQISARGLTEFFRNSQKFRSNHKLLPYSVVKLRNSVQQTLPSEFISVDNCFRSSAREQSPPIVLRCLLLFSTKAAELKCQHVTV